MIHWLILLLVSATCIGTPELFPLAFTKLCRQMVLWTLPLLLFLHLITNRHCRHSSANTIYPNTAISIYSEGGSIKCKVNPECVIYKRNVYSCCPSVDMEHWAPGLLLSSAARSSPSSRVGERQQAGYTFCTSCWSKINYLNSFFPAVSVLIPSFWRHPMDLRCFFFPTTISLVSFPRSDHNPSFHRLPPSSATRLFVSTLSRGDTCSVVAPLPPSTRSIKRTPRLHYPFKNGARSVSPSRHPRRVEQTNQNLYILFIIIIITTYKTFYSAEEVAARASMTQRALH